MRSGQGGWTQRRAGVMASVMMIIVAHLTAIEPSLAQDARPSETQPTVTIERDPPKTVPPDVRAAAEAAVPTEPDTVIVGAYINDIHELDFRSHTYSVDLYIWFRWKNPKANPVKSMEFMNRYNPTDHQRDTLLEEPKEMPDGTLYGIIREQGRFASKFRLEKYPFDAQTLKIIFEDTVSSIALQSYFAVAPGAVTANPDISLPGYKVGAPRMIISDNRYPTNFGDISLANTETYSRVSIEVPVTRPLITVSIKTFVPILLIIMSSTLVLFVRPSFVEGRIGLAITALLTLVALQLTASASLPEVDYLMMIDKAYLASYAFIIAVLTRVVATSWVGDESVPERVVARKDAGWAIILQLFYWLVIGASAYWTMLKF
jgi:hypothetical protein